MGSSSIFADNDDNDDHKTNNDDDDEEIIEKKQSEKHHHYHQQKKTKIETIYLTEQRRIQRLKEFGVTDDEIQKRIAEIKIVQHQRHVTASRPPPIFKRKSNSSMKNNKREKSPSQVKISTNKITFSGSG